MTNHQSNIESLHSVKSNEQRLKSLEEYEREKKNKKRLIKESLNNQTKTKHFKFDSDDDDNQQPKEFIEKKIQLFDNDNDNDLVNIEEHFNDKKVPKKKKKLQDLQAQLTTTNDPRFQFSEQFLDEPNEEVSIEEETKKSLAILDQMTNAKSKPKQKMIRFDPSKTEHRIYEIDSEIATHESQDIKTKSILKTTKAITPVVDSTRTYEFDETKLKSVFDKTSSSTNTLKENGTFQFQFFNNKEPITLPTPKILPSPTPISNGKSKVFLNRPDDTSSDEDEKEEPSASDKIEIKNETFFFFDIDDRLKDGLESFVRTEDLNDLERTWPTKRKEIGEALRTKHRKAIQRKDKHRVFNHRRRQKQQLPKSDID